MSLLMGMTNPAAPAGNSVRVYARQTAAPPYIQVQSSLTDDIHLGGAFFLSQQGSLIANTLTETNIAVNTLPPMDWSKPLRLVIIGEYWNISGGASTLSVFVRVGAGTATLSLSLSSVGVARVVRIEGYVQRLSDGSFYITLTMLAPLSNGTDNPADSYSAATGGTLNADIATRISIQHSVAHSSISWQTMVAYWESL